MMLAGRPDDLRAYAEAVLAEDRPSTAWSGAAQALLSLAPARARALTAAGRDRYPEELEAHRAYQTAWDGDPNLVDEYRARLAAADSAASWYLLGRLLDGDEERAAYREALARPDPPVRARCALGRADARALAWDQVAADLEGCALFGIEGTEVLLLRLFAYRWAGGEGVPVPLRQALAELPGADALRARFAEEADPSAAPVAGSDYGSRLVAALSVPDAPELADLLTKPPADLPPDAARVGAAAAARRGLPIGPFLAAIAPPEDRARFAALRAIDVHDLAAVDAVIVGADPQLQGAWYAAAAELVADPPAEVLERARRLSLPGAVPRHRPPADQASSVSNPGK